ncbi:hypothetical protein HMPREF0974_00318 [Lactobacillus jensenii 115-3-CHN]|nr:hypothetical protein HMPREF0974_00318 [Lactobacillus jensenii 115-3-CHN]
MKMYEVYFPDSDDYTYVGYQGDVPDFTSLILNRFIDIGEYNFLLEFSFPSISDFIQFVWDNSMDLEGAFKDLAEEVYEVVEVNG